MKCHICISIAIILLPPGRMVGVYGAVMDHARAVPRNKKLEVSHNSEDVMTNRGTIGQCAMEENTAFVGATLNDGTMRIKYVQSGVYRFFCRKDPFHFHLLTCTIMSILQHLNAVANVPACQAAVHGHGHQQPRFATQRPREAGTETSERTSCRA